MSKLRTNYLAPVAEELLMRVRVIASGTVVGFCLTLQLGAAVHAQQPDVTTIMSGARDALGGEKRLSAVRTLIATGRTRQLRGENLVPIEFEIDIQLPDKYVRRDEIPAQESGPTSRGFNGAELIQFPVPASPPGGAGRGPAGPPPGAAAARGAAPADPTLPIKQDFVRLTIGFFASSLDVYPVTFSYVGRAEAPEGSAEVVQLAGAANFSARLFLSHQTHLPVMLSWSVPPTIVVAVPGQPPPSTPPGALVVIAPGPPPGPTATPEERQAFQQALAAARSEALAKSPPAENRIYYADYREVDGLKFPFRIRRATGATTTEETTFDRFRINATIDPKKFEVRK